MKPAVNKQDGSRQLRSVSGGTKAKSSGGTAAKKGGFRLGKDKLLEIYDLMLRDRCLEERLIKMLKQSDGYFWIGGPGEEAFNIPLGLNVKVGEGPRYDYLHLHYRSSGIVLAMGEDPAGAIRQMKNVAADPYSGGRNFVNHFSKKAWNIVPVASTIETQFASAIGTGIAQMREGGEGLTIVNGGDAGTAEGEFASCLIWASRPGQELPILMITTNNSYGISTRAEGQHGETNIADRAAAFNIKNKVINGNDVEESWFAIQEAMEYIRKERKPYFIEARVSRLYGHSSASGANFHPEEEDCIETFEKQLIDAGHLTREKADEMRNSYVEQFRKTAQQVKEEPMPDPESIYDHVYCGQKGRYW